MTEFCIPVPTAEIVVEWMFWTFVVLSIGVLVYYSGFSAGQIHEYEKNKDPKCGS